MAGKRRTLGDEHPSTLGSIINLARFLRDLGIKADALEMYRKALEASRRVLGEDHPETKRWAAFYANITN